MKKQKLLSLNKNDFITQDANLEPIIIHKETGIIADDFKQLCDKTEFKQWIYAQTEKVANEKNVGTRVRDKIKRDLENGNIKIEMKEEK